MRRTGVALVAALSLLGPAAAPALQTGDNVVSYWTSHRAALRNSRTVAAVEGWPGYESAALSEDATFDRPPFVLVIRPVGGAPLTVFGAVQGGSAQPALLLDTDGDGRLDWQTTTNVIPAWVLLTLPGKRGDGAGFRDLAARLYRQYNQASGPAPAQVNLLIQQVQARARDAANPDRDLDAAFLFALDSSMTNLPLGTGGFRALDLALKTRGGQVPLLALYLGEAAEALEGPAAAQRWYDRILALDPGSLIGRFKKASHDPAALAAFRRQTPEFWAAR